MSVHIPDVLSGRKINWCPSGEGFPAFCPQPIDPDNYDVCCVMYRDGMDYPTCCTSTFLPGFIIGGSIGFFIFIVVVIFFSCWCCYLCPLFRIRIKNRLLRQQHIERNEEENKLNEF
uniref:CX domain-containing protein n=1 Tax=Parastrongyloides trichosuri TaxID=131310 RepID=A0A0N4ZSS8_PARTI